MRWIPIATLIENWCELLKIDQLCSSHIGACLPTEEAAILLNVCMHATVCVRHLTSLGIGNRTMCMYWAMCQCTTSIHPCRTHSCRNMANLSFRCSHLHPLNLRCFNPQARPHTRTRMIDNAESVEVSKEEKKTVQTSHVIHTRVSREHDARVHAQLVRAYGRKRKRRSRQAGRQAAKKKFLCLLVYMCVWWCIVSATTIYDRSVHELKEKLSKHI